MKWTGLNELREEFSSFFESKGHLRLPSAPLVPQDDGSLLLINSGMAPLKNYFLGLATPPSKRVTTCQKCIRTPDIEEVGKTSRHGTYFEMLGNFSFGDYFKKEATAWALEFLVDRLEMPLDRLWFSIYEDDDETYDIWTKEHGIPPEKIVRLGKADNFWEIGSGPCGPCSEIHYDRGEEFGCDSPTCGVGSCECDRYMEIWNLVFTQYNSDGNGTYTPLEHPNIDTGMGLERLACVMQEVDNLFEVDTVKNIMKAVSKATGVAYKTNSANDISLRVVTDHIRSTVFLVGDGVIPSNEGRGYVLRRLLRRGARHGHLLGLGKPFLYKICDTVIAENKNIYPELEENKAYIKKIIKTEEERFDKTIKQGMETLKQLIDKLATLSVAAPLIAGKDVFQLYDTFGFPIDLTREIAADYGVEVDEKGFKKHMEEQRERARKAHSSQGEIGWEADVLAGLDIHDEFVGYHYTKAETKVLAIVADNTLTDTILEGQSGMLVLEKTPFYAESGGQIGDSGTVIQGNNVFTIVDTKRSPSGHIVHIGKVTKGSLENGKAATAEIDQLKRNRIIRNHTALHLLQAALRALLGDHVHQAGSYVSEEMGRFDFTHFSAVTPEELKQVEQTINNQIIASIPVTIEEMSITDAKAKGAMALFGDKYTEEVRVCSVGDVSMELCGGTHVSNTSQIGLFKILSESSVAAGVRRIEVTSSLGILDLLNNQTSHVQAIGKILKVNSIEELLARAVAVVAQTAELRSKIEELEARIASSETKDISSNLVNVGVVKVGAFAIAGSIDPLQKQADQLKEKHPDMVGVMIAMGEENGSVLVFAGKDAVKAGVHSGKLVKEIATIGGGSGGGRPDNAKGGIADLGKVDDALAAVKGLVEAQLN